MTGGGGRPGTDIVIPDGLALRVGPGETIVVQSHYINTSSETWTVMDAVDICQTACSGGAPDLDRCEEPTDCTITSPSCCGDCEPVRFGRVAAINTQELERYRAIKGCEGVACEPCMAPPPAEQTMLPPNLVAVCDGGTCSVREVGP